MWDHVPADWITAVVLIVILAFPLMYGFGEHPGPPRRRSPRQP